MHDANDHLVNSLTLAGSNLDPLFSKTIKTKSYSRLHGASVLAKSEPITADGVEANGFERPTW